MRYIKYKNKMYNVCGFKTMQHSINALNVIPYNAYIEILFDKQILDCEGVKTDKVIIIDLDEDELIYDMFADCEDSEKLVNAYNILTKGVFKYLIHNMSNDIVDIDNIINDIMEQLQ